MADTVACLDEILAEIRSGAAPKVVDEDTELGLRDALKEDFDRELERDNWGVEGPTVRLRAFEAGQRAQVLAGADHRVTLRHLFDAIKGLGCRLEARAFAGGNPPPPAEPGRYCAGILARP